MQRPAKTTETKLEAYCTWVESRAITLEKERDSLSTKVSQLAMDLVSAKLKKPEPSQKPCDNFVYFSGKCSHCNSPICRYCGKCQNKECRLFLCKGE